MELGDENDSQLQTMAVDADNKAVAASAAAGAAAVQVWDGHRTAVERQKGLSINLK